MSTRQQCIEAEATRIGHMVRPFPSPDTILGIRQCLERVYDHALRGQPDEYEYGVHIKAEPVWPDHDFQPCRTPEEALDLVAFLKIPEYWKVIRRRKAGPWEEMP